MTNPTAPFREMKDSTLPMSMTKVRLRSSRFGRVSHVRSSEMKTDRENKWKPSAISAFGGNENFVRYAELLLETLCHKKSMWLARVRMNCAFRDWSQKLGDWGTDRSLSCMQTLFKRARAHWSTLRLLKQGTSYVFKLCQWNGSTRNRMRRSWNEIEIRRVQWAKGIAFY